MNERNIDFRFVGGREVRVIPKGWRHPIEGGRHVPLLPAGYVFDEDQAPYPMMPDVHHLAPYETEVAAYESVSEGTPISPAFPNTPQGRLDLINYCAGHCTTFGHHKAGAEAWAAILFGDAAVSLDGHVTASD